MVLSMSALLACRRDAIGIEPRRITQYALTSVVELQGYFKLISR